jgi:hypothetical protein
VHACIFIGNSS